MSKPSEYPALTPVQITEGDGIATPELIERLLEDFQDKTKAFFTWRLFAARYAGGVSATNALCKFIADSFNGVPDPKPNGYED